MGLHITSPIKYYTMSDFDDILNSLKKGLGEMTEEVQQKYNELVEYLDTHDSEEIKADLRKRVEEVGADAKEGFEKAKEGLSDMKDEAIDKLGDNKVSLR